jgi:phosphoribosyl 1,2-cyclic phosphodiesterase
VHFSSHKVLTLDKKKRICQISTYFYQKVKTAAMITLSSLGSGSSGNAFIASAGNEAIIIDMGFSRRELKQRMSMLGIDPASLTAALLTHDHDDHSKGCRVFCDEFNLPLYTASGTARYLRLRGKLPRQVVEFEAGATFTIGGFSINTFAVPHDAEDPVGFVVSHGNHRIGFATDLGVVNALTKRHLCDCDALVLESNYDQEMLRRSDRTLQLKRRIAGRFGHLDNAMAAEAFDELVTERTKLLLLAHVSRECNDPELVRECCAAKLSQLRRYDLQYAVLRQEKPVGGFVVGDIANAEC